MCFSKVARILLAVLLTANLPSVVSAATILLIRHADRNPGMSPDVLLNAAGEQRAKELADVLKDANVKRIYVTELKRMQQTAEPLALQLHLKPEVIPAKDVDVLVGKLRELGEDETVLVVGNVNTTPQVVEKLGGGSVPAFVENEYDRLTVLFTGASGKPRVLTLRYGKPAH